MSVVFSLFDLIYYLLLLVEKRYACEKISVMTTWYILFTGHTNRERFDVPLHHILLRHPLGAACAGLELGWVSITGHRHQNGHVVGSGAALKLTFSLQMMSENRVQASLKIFITKSTCTNSNKTLQLCNSVVTLHHHTANKQMANSNPLNVS